ncbi:MAG: hypothetical protein O3A49_05180 [Candidatus Marinimicrobia bacterium]|nr:hypothetical protein [Candidatus Neomarinimicrobiota bacterium]
MNNKDIEKKEKRKKQAIERSNQLNNESEIFKELVIDIKKLDSTSSFLGIIKIYLNLKFLFLRQMAQGN